MKEALPLNESVLVFLHIKKTGGISLQKLIQDQFPGKFYGNDHSALKKKIKIKKSDIKNIPNGSAVANHWKYEDFKSIKDRCNFVTIIRNPVDRIVSAYNFYIKHNEKKISFSEYISTDSNINVMSKTISDIDELAEAYIFDSLRGSLSLSRIFQTRDIGHLNKTFYTEIKNKYIFYPTRDKVSNFRDLNNLDMSLYNGVKDVC